MRGGGSVGSVSRTWGRSTTRSWRIRGWRNGAAAAIGSIGGRRRSQRGEPEGSVTRGATCWWPRGPSMPCSSTSPVTPGIGRPPGLSCTRAGGRITTLLGDAPAGDDLMVTNGRLHDRRCGADPAGEGAPMRLVRREPEEPARADRGRADRRSRPSTAACWWRAPRSPTLRLQRRRRPGRLRVGTTVDLDTDNPFAVSAGNDWSVSTSSTT